MKLTVIGCGYLGTTHAACMAELGHDVIGMDADMDKVHVLGSGKAPFFERDLDDLLAKHTASIEDTLRPDRLVLGFNTELSWAEAVLRHTGAGGREDDVLRLYIPVHHPRLVDRGQRLCARALTARRIRALTDSIALVGTARNDSRTDTAKGDSGEASIATWKDSRPARTPAENDVPGAMGTGAWLDPVAYPDFDRTITFHEPRGEAYIAASGQEFPSVAVQELAELACLGLRDIVDSYPDSPYNEYVVVDTAWKDGPSIVWEDNFRTNTACSTSIQDRSAPSEGEDSWWKPTTSGLE